MKTLYKWTIWSISVSTKPGALKKCLKVKIEGFFKIWKLSIKSLLEKMQSPLLE